MPQQAPWSDIGRLQQEVHDLQRQLHRKVDEHKIGDVFMKLESLEQRYRELDSRVQNVEAQIQVLQEFQRNYEAMRPEY